jgi:hypothetical protein
LTLILVKTQYILIYDIIFTLQKQGSYKTMWFTVGDGGTIGETLDWWQTQIESGIASISDLLPTLTLVTSTATSLTYTLELGYYGNSDWDLLIQTSTNGTITDGLFDIVCEPLQDAFSTEKAGALTPIKFSNKGNELICFNTTGDKEAAQFEVLVSPDSGVWRFYPINYTLTLSEYEVFLSGIAADLITIVSGYFIILPVTGQTYYQIKPSMVINPITSIPMINLGVYTATLFRNTASTIGIATKDERTNEWNYTELLRSNKLNFRTYSQIRDAIVTSTDLGTNIDWTDKLNPIRRLLYKGQWIENGFLTLYNSEALYSLDTINEESKLQLGQNTSKITMSVSHIGGTKPEASYIAFVRFGSKEDGVQTGWSHYSNRVWTHSMVLSQHQYGNATTFSLDILIEQIPLNQFSVAQVGIVEIGSNKTFKAYTLPEISVDGVTEIRIKDTGDTTQYGIFDAINEVEVPLVVFENAGNLLDFDNYIISSDVKLSLPYDLSEWARTIVLTTAVRTMQIKEDYAAYQQSYGWLANGYNSTLYMSDEWLSCMPSEWHRIAVAIDWKNGAPTSYFWVADHYIDPTLTNYQITDDSVTTINVNQYHIEASGINMNYLLPDGQLVKDVVKDIRFARTLVKQEILATGVGITVSPFEIDGNSVLNIKYAESNAVNPIYNDGSKLALYSPDLINNGQTLTFKSGDEVIALPSSIQHIKVLSGALGLVAIDYFGNVYSDFGELTISPIDDIQDLATGEDGKIMNLGNVPSGITGFPTVTNLGCVSIDLAHFPLPNNALFSTYYRRPISTSTSDSPYKNNVLTDRFFIVPQDKWYDENTHDSSTPYKIFSGDCFPQKQYYRLAKDSNTDYPNRWSNLVGFYSYNRTNGAMRSGTQIGWGFPTQSVFNMLTDSTISDDYILNPAFIFSNQFQSATPYNPELLYTEKTISTIYYSGKRLNGALYGNNRIWKFNDNGVLENVYGRIIDMSILLGTSGNNAIYVKQERNTTLQYFDNTARLITTSVEAILGTGGILDTKGTFLTLSGCSHKFGVVKGLSPISNKEIEFFYDANKVVINRFGADGSRTISDSISSFLLKNTTLALLNGYNNEDRPAHDFGVLGSWDNQKKEYVLTFRLIAKNRNYERYVPNAVGDVLSGGTTFGFENIPILYKCIVANTNEDLTNPLFFTEYKDYIDEMHQCYTLVWNELDNLWKGFYSYIPKLYGNVANNYVSRHPTSNNLVYEHNYDNNARYYCDVPTFGAGNGFSISLTGNGYLISSIDADDIASWFGVSSFPFAPTLEAHTSYYLYLPIQKIYVRIIEFIDAYNVLVDVNEPLIGITLTNELYYTTCNTGQPLIEGVFNEGYPRYFSFGDIQLNIDLPPNKIETIGGLDSLGQKTTKSYMEYTDFKYEQGQARVASGMDTTKGNTNKRGFQGIEGYWMKLKTLFQPNIKNKMLDQQVIVTEQNKRRT